MALVIGRRARRVSRSHGWDHVAWITAANDFGVYDLRYADRGSNVRSKGIDGFTPLGPRLIDARAVDLAAVRLRTWVNGDLAQDAWPAQDMLFGFGDIVADLSRLVTLEPGDVILTGTPTGSTVVNPGDVVEVEVSAGDQSSGRLRSPITEADYRLDPPGAMPRADDAARSAALAPRAAPRQGCERGRRWFPSAPGDPGRAARGLHRDAGRAAAQARPERPHPGRAAVHPPRSQDGRVARTVRYLPLREDLSAVYGGGMNAQNARSRRSGPGEVLVIEARGDPTAGTIGDILGLRAQVRGAAGVVTDGAIRDSVALAGMEIPVYHAAVHPAVLGRRHVPWETGVTVACAGVTVQPGDILVGDADGVVVLPPGIAAEVLAEAREQERQEEFIASRVALGDPLDGLHPLSDARRPDYEAWLAQGGAS